MGINAELVKLVVNLRNKGALGGSSLIELGAQDVCVADQVANGILNGAGIASPLTKIRLAQHLYAALGFDKYSCIDASGDNSSLVFDLNEDIREKYKYNSSFDLVTNLGTAEHCFNQYAVFKNIHDLCKVGGTMIHALPAQGNVNHAFYNYHPRFFADLSAANNYEIVDLSFTVDYKPTLIPYSVSNFKEWDSHDILFYATLKKCNDEEFRTPFDGMFASSSRLSGYRADGENPLETEFSPYLKGGNWENTKGLSVDATSRKSAVARFLRRLFAGMK